jgi:hypothetical protein
MESLSRFSLLLSMTVFGILPDRAREQALSQKILDQTFSAPLKFYRRN